MGPRGAPNNPLFGLKKWHFLNFPFRGSVEGRRGGGVAAPQGSLCTFETMVHLLVFLREPMHLSPQPALDKENMHSIAHTSTAKELENLRSWICKTGGGDWSFFAYI